MAPTFMHKHWVEFMVLLFVVCNTTAFRFGKKDKDLTSNVPQFTNQNLATLIRPVPEDQSRVYTQALDILNSMQASPSCNRLATTTLIDSCQSIDGTERDSEVSLDDSRSIYAAQLAMCEIMSADSAVPPSCKALTPNPKAHLYRDQRAQGARKAHLSSCLQSLESRPQWWTSYSNSRQNAMVICQAARTDVDKDELIKLYRTSVQTHRDADATLAQAVEYSTEELKRQREEFALVRRAFEDQLLRDIKTTSARAQFYFQKLIASLDAGVQTILARVNSATRNVETDIVRLGESVHSANVESRDLEKNVGRVFQKVAEGSAELVSTQTRYLDESNELAIGLRLSLQQMRDMDAHDIIMMVRQMHGQLEVTNELVVAVSARQNAIADQMAQLNHSMASLQTNAQALQEAQLRQGTTQQRLHDEMETGMNTSLVQLLQIEGSAAKLQASIQDASQSVAQIASLAWVVSRFWTWGSLAIVLAIVMFGIFRTDAKFAGIIVGAIGMIEVLKCSSALLLDLVYGRSPSTLAPPIQYLVLISFTIGILMALGLYYHHKSSRTSKPRFSDSSGMHFLRRAPSERKFQLTSTV